MKKQSINDLLQEVPFFQDLAPQHFSTLSCCGSLKVYSAGEMLMREGDPAETFFVVRKGEVAIETHAPGVGNISVARVTSSGIVGYSWLFPPHRVAFDVFARTQTKVIALDGRCLREKADSNHELGYELMKRFAQIMLQRLQATRRQLLNIYAPKNLSSLVD